MLSEHSAIDSFLRMRNSQDHEATAMMKAQFMSLWDGLITDPSVVVIVMGATNRPRDLDQAIMRRMPSMFHVGLPVSLHHDAWGQNLMKTRYVS